MSGRRSAHTSLRVDVLLGFGLLAVAASVVVAVRLLRAIRTASTTPVPRSLLPVPSSVWTSVDGRMMHARVAGDSGDLLVVCVHGLGVSSRYFVPTQVRLARECRVYAPDLPGFGLSDAPPHVPDIPELARVLAGWMQASGLHRAAFVGNSMGCQVIAHLAMNRPDLVTRAVFSAPTMDPHARNALLQIMRLLRVAPHEQPSQILLAIHDYLESGILRAYRTYRHAMHDRIETILPLLTVPVLIVRGGRDPIVSPRWAEEAAALLPHGALLTLPDSPHAAHYSTPDEFTSAILPFLHAHSH